MKKNQKSLDFATRVIAVGFTLFLFPGCSKHEVALSPRATSEGSSFPALFASDFEKRRDGALKYFIGRNPEIDRSTPGALANSVANFALPAFWLDEQHDTANGLLREYAETFINDRKARNDQHSFYASVELVTRIVFMYGSQGSEAPGRLQPDVEALLLEVMWLYASETSYVDSYEEFSAYYARKRQEGFAAEDPKPVSANIADTRTWDVLESENHHAMTWMTLWDFTRLLQKSPAYRDRAFEDGHTAAEHHAAWTEYAKEYLRQRARKGLLVEMADGTYNTYTLKGLYNMVDFSGDADLRQLASDPHPLLCLMVAGAARRGAWRRQEPYERPEEPPVFDLVGPDDVVLHGPVAAVDPA
jgi:hypothetical protein